MSRIASYCRGFREISAIQVIVALLVVLAAVSSLAIVVDEELVGALSGRDLLRFGRSDDDLEVISLALELQRRSPDDPLVIILGASETREMVDVESLERSIRAVSGSRADVLRLAAPRLSKGSLR